MAIKEDPYGLQSYSDSDEIDIIQSVLRDYQPESMSSKGGYTVTLGNAPEFITNYERSAIIYGIRQLGLHTVSKIKYDEKARQVYIYLS